MAVFKDIGLRIKEIRIENKFNQTEYADKIGISRAALWQIESGKINPSLELLYKIIELHNISFDFLLLGEKRLIIGDIMPSENRSLITDITQLCYVEINPIVTNLNLVLDILSKNKLIEIERHERIKAHINKYKSKSIEWMECINSSDVSEHKSYLHFFEAYYKVFITELNLLLDLFFDKARSIKFEKE